MEKLASTGAPGQHQMHCQAGAMAVAAAAALSTSSASQTPIVGTPLAPPRTPPDQASIQSSMDKNKESLKRKLMLRRSVNELVDRGIYPPLKTPPAFAEKTKQLERAKTGDLLRHKIQHRPDRQALVQQHILEDTTIDPSLHERQRLLKRSRLLDGLNDKLAHRPGPLELVQGNILQPSNELANAIKDGTIQFIPTCDTEDMDQSGSSYTFDEESVGSDGAPSPQMDESSGLSDVSSPSSTTPITTAESFPISFTFSKSIAIPVTISKGQQIPLVPSSTSLAAMALSKQPVAVTTVANINSHSSSGKPRSKKLKPKATSKARIIKFHEYKGPPSVVKNQSTTSSTPAPTFTTNSNTNNNNNPTTEDTPYHIMLQQQQLFLQWQLEFQQKQQQQGSAVSPGIPTSSMGDASSNQSNVIVTSPVISSTCTSPSFIQPLSVGSNLVSTVSLQQPQVQPSGSQALLNQQPGQLVTHISQTPPIPPPPPPLPPSRPTQSVAPRTAAKALTAIPANALSLPKLTGNLEEMKVADLKAELKKRSLPVSGPKPQLIERLKPFTESVGSNNLLVPSATVSKTSTPLPPSRVSTPLQFSQTSFQIKQEPNGDSNATSIIRPIPSTTSTPVYLTSGSTLQSSNMPIHLPLTTLGLKTVVSVKPMIKEEPMATTDISPPNSPQSYVSAGQCPRTPMTPDYDSTSPPPVTSKMSPQVTQSLLKSSANQLVLNTCHTVMAPGQTVVSMSTDHTQPSSVVPAEMMPMEVDSVSVDLNQGVDDTAFKAASLGHSLDSVNFKTLIQPMSNSNFKTISLSQNSLDTNPIKINTNFLDTSSIKTVNLSPNYETNNTIKSVSLSPNTEAGTVKAVNLGCSPDSMSSLKTLNLSPNTDLTGFKTIGPNSSSDSNSLLKTVKVPLSQLSPTHLSPVQLTAPLTQTLTSQASLIQLQQLQQLQTLQQLLQQTQAQQQLQQQALQQQNSVALTTNDHVVLAQAKQIEELQRQLQESHLKLKLQQLQQQQMQLQQQQQQMWQVRIPSNFPQNSLLTKLSQEQLTIPQQISQVLTGPVQLQNSLAAQQTMASVVQQQQQQQQQQPTTSIFLNGHSLQQTPLIMSGMQQQKQQQQTSVTVSNSSNVSTASNSLNLNSLSTVTSESNLISMVTSANGQPAVSLPYAIHINLTSSGQMKLPPQLQPITTSTASAVTAVKSPTLPSLQLPAQLLLNAHSQSLLNAQPIKPEPVLNAQPIKPEPSQSTQPIKTEPMQSAQSIKTEPGIAQTMGPPATTTVPKSQISSIQPFLMNPVSNALITGHANGIITRTASLPSTPLVSEQAQKQTAIQRCTSNPFFNGPFKEPPRYDEAIKIKQQQTAPSLGTNMNSNKVTLGSNSTISVGGSNNKPLGLKQTQTDVKSQTMDDVLEILIRNGDLPPSAATEPLPTPKLNTTVTQPTVSTSSSSFTSLSVMTCTSPVSHSSLAQCHSPFTSAGSMQPHSSQQLSNQHNSSSPRDQTLASVHTGMYDSFLNDNCNTSPSNGDMGPVSSLTSQSDNGELLDWGEMLPSPDLSNMDWSSEPGFSHIDLGDSSLNLETKSAENIQGNTDPNSGALIDHFSPSYRSETLDSRYNFLLGMEHFSPPYKSNPQLDSDMITSGNSNGLHTPSRHGSEPDLTVLGLGGDSSDTVDPSSQMDMSDWLDVIMPNAGLPVNHIMPAVSNVSFTADPILTPRSQQDVFDIFNFDDSDFTPSMIGIN
ncbi:MKL/myocardin protein 2 [Biomphalaria glabrata]|nr:MKL/myocardin protein 2 [Biomphalaria glabrata]